MKPFHSAAWRLTALAITAALVSGCESLQSNEKLQKFGRTIGVVDEKATMRVPDYYSTKQVNRHYRVGQTYLIEDLRCQNGNHRCRN